MPPEGYMPRWERDFWDTLLEEQGVRDYKVFDGLPGGIRYGEKTAPNYNVGDVLVGEIVDETLEIGA